MTSPTLTVSIGRTSLSLSPLVFSGTVDGNVLGVVNFQAPAYLPRIKYAPDSDDVHGSEPISWAYQQGLLSWDWMRDRSTSETQVQAARDEVRAALAQFSYTVTTQVSGAPAEVWAANPGTLTPPARTYVDLAYLVPVFVVTIPVYPIAS